MFDSYDSEKVKKRITDIINRSLAGQEIEEPKIDCKVKWYKLTDIDQIHEFTKDTSAIANTFGPEGFIIIGYDDKIKKFSPALFTDCGLRDSSDIVGKINRYVNPGFDIITYDLTIDGNPISVICIPPSIVKPHILPNYRKNGVDHLQRIYVRKNTSSVIANRSDIELMIYDRKNITPDYDLRVSLRQKAIANPLNGGRMAGVLTELKSTLRVIIENIGKRPVAITEISFIKAQYLDSPERDIKMVADKTKFDPFVVESGKIHNAVFEFTAENLRYEKEFYFDIWTEEKKISARNAITFTIVNGEEITTEFNQFF